MTPEPFSALELDDTFQFACHPQVSCFNHCCRDLNQALAPFDVLRLRRRLGISSREFLDRHTREHIGPASGLPIVTLRFEDSPQRACPFVTPAGCRVYDARPASCRLYPLVRALRRSRVDGRTSVHYALLKEPHCRGFHESRRQTVGEWIAAQELTRDFKSGDGLMALIALKNRLRPGPLPEESRHLVHLALYDLDQFKTLATAGELQAQGEPQPDSDDDLEWLEFSLDWVRRKLFGKAC